MMRAAALAGCLVLVACGIDAVGAQGAAPSTDDAGSSSGGGTNANGGDAAPGPSPPPPSGTSTSSSDAAPDAPPMATSAVTISTSPLPSTFDLTTEGAIDWAYWAYEGTASSVARKNGGGGAIGDYAYTGSSRATNTQQWPARQSWTDGAPPATTGANVGWYTYFNTGNAVITLPVAAATTKRTLTLLVGAGDVKASVVAALDDGSASATLDDDSKGAQHLLRVDISFSSATPGHKLEVTWKIVQRYNPSSPGDAINFSSAALK